MTQPPHEPRPGSVDPERVAREIEVQFYRASGPGGQHRNKVETAVRIRHLPTGIVVTASEERSQSRNRAVAFERLLERLRRLKRRRKKRVPTRKSKAVKTRERQARERRAGKKRERRQPEG